MTVALSRAEQTANARSQAHAELARQRVSALKGVPERIGGDSKKRCLMRRAETIVIVPERLGTVIFNYATNEVLDYTPFVENVLGAANNWTTPEVLVRRAGRPRRRAIEQILSLMSGGFLVVRGTHGAKRDVQFEKDWDWDIRAGLLHLAIRNPLLHTEKGATAELADRIKTFPRIPLFETNDAYVAVKKLPKPLADGAFWGVLGRRRTRRRFRDDSVPIRAISDCLYAGLGITGFLAEPMRGLGRIPLKMTPSGGARNPYEAFVYSRRVVGLASGIYHYSAVEHSLGLVTAPPIPWPSEFFGDQMWTDRCAAAIFLVANYKRTMWKYPHPMAYRAVLIEAGHIAQNIMLAATSHGLTANPTALFRDSLIERCLRMNSVVKAVNYAILIGRPGSSAMDYGRFVPNAHPSKARAR